MHPGATHIALLAATVARSTGPVIELGCGYFSTPMLHHLCKGRHLVSIDHDPAWVDQFRDLENADHTLLCVKDWSEVTGNKLSFDLRCEWAVAFVDCAPAEARVPLIEQFSKIAKQIVIHDTEHSLYGYEKIWPLFKYRYDDKRLGPWTSVVSNTVEFEP
jgi:hypothetical protein